MLQGRNLESSTNIGLTTRVDTIFRAYERNTLFFLLVLTKLRFCDIYSTEFFFLLFSSVGVSVIIGRFPLMLGSLYLRDVKTQERLNLIWVR